MATTSDALQTKMAHAGTPVGEATAHPLQPTINHRKLIATIFPQSVSGAMTDSQAAVGIEDQEEMLHCAASQGMLFSVLALLADGSVSCDLRDRFGRTPLHWAAEQGHRNVVFELLSAGACVDPRSQRKATPLMLAASGGHAEIVGVLLHYRAGESDCWPLDRHRHGIDHWRSTALHCAAAGGHVGLVAVMLDAGFDRGQRDGAGLTPAEVSARQSHTTSPAVTRLLLPASDMGGKLVYDYVNMAMEDVATVSGLVKGGAFLNWQDVIGDTPLHRAVLFGHFIISRVLLQAGANPNIRDHQGSSALHTAVSSGYEEIVPDLLEAGADMQPRMVDGCCPLHLAVNTNRANVVSLLLSAGGSMEHRDATHGQTPLSSACERFLAPVVRVLVEAGADVESRSSAGLTPLHWACRFIDAESVEILLNAGADPCAVDQAAANDAVAKSSCGSGTIVPMPIATDVIGLGYPLGRTEDSTRLFTGDSGALAARRLDLALVKNIESALQGAKQERSWRRRGWLVVLANRRVAMGAPGVPAIRAVSCCDGCRAILPSSIRSRCIDTVIERPRVAHEQESARYPVDANTNNDSSDYQHPHQELSNGNHDVGKRPRSVDNVVMIARATSPQQGQRRGELGAQANAAALLTDLVDALLQLAAAEVGVFRKVVIFI